MDLMAKEVMRRDVTTVPTTMTLPELERAFLETGVGGFPVLDGEQLAGVVTRTDLVRAADAERQTARQVSDYYLDDSGFHEVPTSTPEELAARVGQRLHALTVGQIMQTQIHAVGPDQPLKAVAQLLTDEAVHRVLVTREGRLLGVISTSDFARLYAQGRLRAG